MDETVNNCVVITDTKIVQAITLKHALRFYDKHHKQVNTAYTPMAMMQLAQKITGKIFNARDYLGAAEALEIWTKFHSIKPQIGIR